MPEPKFNGQTIPEILEVLKAIECDTPPAGTAADAIEYLMVKLDQTPDPGVVRWVIGYRHKEDGDFFIVEQLFQQKSFAIKYAKRWILASYPYVVISKFEGNLVGSENLKG